MAQGFDGWRHTHCSFPIEDPNRLKLRALGVVGELRFFLRPIAA